MKARRIRRHDPDRTSSSTSRSSASPTFSEVSPTAHDYALVSSGIPGRAPATATADVQPAGGIVIPPTPTPSSASGCTAADFSGFVAGPDRADPARRLQLRREGPNAQAAGASGVIIFNEGNPGRTGLLVGQPASTRPGTRSSRPSRSRSRRSPSAQTSTTSTSRRSAGTRAAGDEHQHPGDRQSERRRLQRHRRIQGRRQNNVVVVDAHLDAIYGAGMLDNASGSATILDIAQKMKNVNPLNKLRFIWFGGEELGLLGSTYYVNNLTLDRAQPHRLRPRRGRDGDAELHHRGPRPGGAGPLQRGTVTHDVPEPRLPGVDSRAGPGRSSTSTRSGKNHEFFSPVGTDAFSFNRVGIPASGLLTGQDCCKTQDEVDLFGGYLGNYEGNVPSFDGGCVDNPFRWCDNLEQQRPEVLTFMSKAFANDGRPDGLRHQGDVREQQRRQQAEAAHRRRSGRHPQEEPADGRLRARSRPRHRER